MKKEGGATAASEPQDLPDDLNEEDLEALKEDGMLNHNNNISTGENQITNLQP